MEDMKHTSVLMVATKFPLIERYYMNKQSVILTKWVTDSNTLLEDYSQLILLIEQLYEVHLPESRTSELLNQIDNMIANSDVGTKWKLTLEKVEE